MTADEHEQRATEIIAQYNGGLPVKRLEERFAISTWALYNLLRRHEVPLRGTARPDSATRRAVAEYERLRSGGVTRDEIAEKFGIKPGTLYRALLRRRTAADH
ncbi:hypothetical protein ACFC0M_12325 [Streptomyces sp. NPDC056149]|uniref:hypothetical protein n=1 Tax=Streptomyces sp. NPDC056149 TaxID=3345728 RepID=UPI0035E123FE